MIDIELSTSVKRIKLASIFALTAKVNELIASGKKIINLGMGEPDFDTPQHIKEAAIKAIRDGFTKYTAVDGILSLKKTIIERMAFDNKLQYEPSNIIVSCGSKHSLYIFFMAVLNPGTEVIIQAPYWPAYPDMINLLGAKPIIVETQSSERFKLMPEQLESAITSKTKLLIMNVPSNPTGITYSTKELAALGEVLLKHPNILIVSDDIYEHTVWNHHLFANIVMACPELYDRSVIINGVSKSYAMTGWRIGYAAGPKKIINAMKIIQSQMTSCPTSISQVAAQAALSGDQSYIKEMTKIYKERHDFIINELRTIPGIECYPSDGTFYTFPNVSGCIEAIPEVSNDLDFVNYLIDAAGVSVIPGSLFGAEGHIRISYATSFEKIKEAMVSMRNAIKLQL